MKVAVIGSGGREHALIKKIAKSPLCSEVVALPGNGGIAQDARCVDIKATDIDAVVLYCRQNQFDYVVVAPDDPLALGMVDALEAAGIPAFGPNKAAAQIEASKVFSKNLMKKYGIPTAAYETFSNSKSALAYLEKASRFPVVIKADGLALGKGVLICTTQEEAAAAVHSMMEDKVFGASGSQIVIEEFLIGPEVSVLSFCDGETLVPMISSMDHKRALDCDEGPNTGGMGTIAPNPFYTPAMAERCLQEIFLPTVRAMREEGAPFKGCLYFGLMLTENGPKVIEYNCRFGDPETQVVLPLLESDLLEVMYACTKGALAPEMVRFSNRWAACVIMASGGYPGKYETGLPITGLREAEKVPKVELYHAGTRMQNGKLCTAGGRVLGVTATGPVLTLALTRAYKAVRKISFDSAFCRNDIGVHALAELEAHAAASPPPPPPKRKPRPNWNKENRALAQRTAAEKAAADTKKKQ